MAAPEVISIYSNDIKQYQIEFAAIINPNGLETTYAFQYDFDSGFSNNLNTATFTLAGHVEYDTVRVVQSGLIADTDYYYKVVATNIDGTNTGLTMKAKTLLPEISTELQKNIEYQTQINQPLYRDINALTPEKSSYVYNIAAIGQGINLIFKCKPKQRFFNNDFGADLDSIPFNLSTPAVRNIILSSIIEPITMFEQRAYLDISNTIINLNSEDIDNNAYNIQIAFGLKDSPNKLYTMPLGG